MQVKQTENVVIFFFACRITAESPVSTIQYADHVDVDKPQGAGGIIMASTLRFFIRRNKSIRYECSY